MAKNWQDRGYDILNNFYANTITGAAVMLLSALYTRFGLAWTQPIINAFITGVLFFLFVLAIRVLLSSPLASRRITLDNVGARVLEWLHKFRVGVRVVHDPSTAFSYVVTTDGQKAIMVKRHLALDPEYLSIVGLITLTDSQKDFVITMSQDEQLEAMSGIQQELMRARIGYNTVDVINDGFIMFKKVPIRATMHEEDVMDAVWDVEAMISMILQKNALTEIAIRKKRGQQIEGTIPRRSGGLEEV